MTAFPVYPSNGGGEASPVRQPDSTNSLTTISSKDSSVLDKTLNYTSPLRTGWVAFGDSYSAGLGAGAEADDSEDGSNDCRRRQGSFPWALNESEWLKGDTNDPEFQFLACSGALTLDIPHQLEQFINGGVQNKDFATITIGGNDVGFESIMIHCILRAYGPFSNCARKTADFMNNLATLAEILERTYTSILDAADRNGAPKDFRLIIVTYPEFFNADTKECDDYSFGYWNTFPSYMTRPVRKAINSMTKSARIIIHQVVGNLAAEYPGKIHVVDSDPYFVGHKFCEPGVVEPDKNNDMNYFFLIDGHDTPGVAPSIPGRFKTTQNPTQSACKGWATGGSDQSLSILCALEEATQIEGEWVPADWLGYSDSRRIAAYPEESVKIFHPKSIGGAAIAQAIIDNLSVQSSE